MKLTDKTTTLYLIIIAGFVFASMALLIKSLSDSLPTEMIVFSRFCFISLLLLPFIKKTTFRPTTLSITATHFITGIANLCAIYCFFYSINQLPLFNAVSLFFSAPLFVVFVTRIWIGKRIAHKVYLPVIIGFIGLIITLTSNNFRFGMVAVVAITGGVLQSIARIGLQRLQFSESFLKIFLYSWIIPTLISALPLSYAWKSLSFVHLLILFLSIVFSILYQLILKKAVKAPSFKTYASYFYTAIFFVALLDLIFFRQLPTLSSFGSAIVIICGIILLIRDEPKLFTLFIDLSYSTKRKKTGKINKQLS